jgi:SNF2 family DNA or RNA helicase
MLVVDTFDDRDFKIIFEFDPKLLALVQSLPNRVFIKSSGYWIFPIVDFFILKKICKELDIEIQATPAANDKYLEIAARLKVIKEIADSNDVEHEVLGLKKEVRLYPFQRVAIKFGEEVGDGLIALDMGLGKTLIGMSIASNYIQKNGYKKILVICPASVKYEWAAQLNKFTDYSYSVVSGKDRDKQYRKKTSFVIVNYDLLYRDIDSIQDIEWDLVICDEIQRARNYQTDTLKALLKVKAKHRLGMTGTPIENDLMDLFTIMKYIDPRIFGNAVTSFRNRYCTLDYFGRIDHSKYRNLEEINKKLCFVMLRRRKRDVLDDLPQKIVNHFYVTLGTEERKQYNEIKAGILEDIATGKIKNVTALAKVGYLRQLCDCLNLVASKEKIVSAKLKEMKQIISELPADSKIVIFTQYERMAKIIEDNIGVKNVHLHGGVKNECRWESEIEKDVVAKHLIEKKKVDNIDELIHEETKKAICGNCPYYKDDSKCKTRKKMVYSFTNDDEIRFFISTDAGKSGINLQRANVLINFDMSFNPAVNEQRNARIDRMGQDSAKILIINLICIDTIEEKVLKILEKKQNLFDKVIDDLSEEDAERLIMNNQKIKELI